MWTVGVLPSEVQAATSVGVGGVQAAAEVALAALAGAFASTSVSGSRAEWAAAISTLQQVTDVANAAQDAAIVRLAAIEPEWLDDGTEVETHKALGHIALDAPSILSGVLVTAPLHAERRVRTAAHLAADGPAGSDSHTGLGGLHAAMGAGRLDAYRATVVTEELEHAPAEVRASVVAALEEHFDREDGTHLRRRCRRVLARISPDLLLQRAARARAESGLRRWADEPGVDKWEGTFPSEEAAQAWAAIDAVARQYVSDGQCTTIERARAKALTDLVAGNATIETVLTLTVPAEALPGPAPATSTAHHATRSATATAASGPAAPGAARGSGAEALARANDPAATAERSVGNCGAEPAAANGSDESGRVDGTDSAVIGIGDLVEITGPAAGQPVLVSREWLAETAETAGSQVAPCHPVTGALLEPPPPTARGGRRDSDALCDYHRDREATSHNHHEPAAGVAAAAGTDAYRPSARMARRIRARDRRCRFPGCTVAAVFCDLDHVRPWPAGRTADDNLLCLCRRHHRVKQRRGWRVTLGPDGVATWTDPTARVRTTYPVDALHVTVLTAPPTRPGEPAPPVSTSRARTVIPDGPHTELEFRLEHLATTGPPRTGRRHPYPPTSSWRDDHGIRHVPELTPSIEVIVLHETATSCRRTRRRGRPAFPDEPPF